ncbi:MAG: radical SAM protein [Thermodesulfovibrionia bacterium]|nr:radical SAM protein [Thermodesulfovibrionia bacterium]
MESAVVVTYRCNAKCQMCNTWQHPSRKSEEIGPEIMDKIPSGQHRINLTGGEAALRDDLMDIVSVLVKKTPRLEISTNGFFTERLVAVGKKYPQVTFRISLEGLPALNDEIRGIKNGFDHAMKTVLGLMEAGVKDVGFGMVVTDKNANDLLDLYRLCSYMGVEFATCVMHNSFYFHKHDNKIEDLDFVVRKMNDFITALLASKRKDLRLRLKDMGRAYINYGLTRYMKGEIRSLQCGAAKDLFFLDPYGMILACNGSEEPWVMGDLKTQDFDNIWNSPKAEEVRQNVKKCGKNCWMVGTAVPAMRKTPWIPLLWITENKLRLKFNKEICLD